MIGSLKAVVGGNPCKSRGLACWVSLPERFAALGLCWEQEVGNTGLILSHAKVSLYGSDIITETGRGWKLRWLLQGPQGRCEGASDLLRGPPPSLRHLMDRGIFCGWDGRKQNISTLGIIFHSSLSPSVIPTLISIFKVAQKPRRLYNGQRGCNSWGALGEKPSENRREIGLRERDLKW